MISPLRRAVSGVAVVAGLVASLCVLQTASAGAQPSIETVYTARRTYAAYNSKQAIDEAMSSPAIGDVTGDGKPDIVVGGMDGTVQVLDLESSMVVATIYGDLFLPGSGGMVQASPALADLDGDGVLDVVVATTNAVSVSPVSPMRSYVRGFRVVGGTITEVFRGGDNALTPMNGFFGTPAVGDIDGDGQLEVVASGLDHQLYAWNLDESNVAGFPVYTWDTMLSSPALADVDGDGMAEIVVGGDMDYGHSPFLGGGYLWVVNGDGSVFPGYPKRLGGEVIWSSPAVGDLNGDGRLDVVVGTGQFFGGADGTLLHAIDVRSATHLGGWPRSLVGATTPSPAIANVHGNALPEVITSTSAGWIYALDAGGNTIWATCGLSFSPCGGGAQVISSPVVADIDGDGAEEVLYNGERQVKILQGWSGATMFAGQTNMLSEDAAYTHAGAASPAVANYGGRTYIANHVLEERNGDNRRGAGDWQAVWVWRTSAAGTAASWPTFQRNVARTGLTGPGPAPLPAYVNAAYGTLLGRPADQAGIAYWGNQLGNGMPRASFGLALARTSEWVGQVVADRYQRVFGRPVDAGGLAYWSGLVQGGMRVASLSANLYASQEFYSGAGGTDAGWVDALYQNILGRGADPDGHAYWVAQLAAGAPRQAAANALFLSYESNVERVDALYATILGRTPDPDGRDYWGRQLETLDDIHLAALLVASDEFFAMNVDG